MPWKVKLIFDDGEEEELDEEFETEEEAEEAGWQASSDFSQGGEYLALAGEQYSDAEVVEVETWEE